MDLVYPVSAGIDVHRDSLVVTVSRAVGRRQESETRTFGAVTEELRALVAWLDGHDVVIVGTRHHRGVPGRQAHGRADRTGRQPRASQSHARHRPAIDGVLTDTARFLLRQMLGHTTRLQMRGRWGLSGIAATSLIFCRRKGARRGTSGTA